MDRSFLAQAQCFFAGGTRIVLELGEYRESRDVDFLCSSRDGYRQLREAVSEISLGRVVTGKIPLAREVRSDLYGIRTFVDVNGTRLKFEIVREARIDIEGETVAAIPVTCLTRRHCFAEKFLANADRGLDASTLCRDIVDLAFMIEGWSEVDARTGFTIATAAYGEAVQRSVDAVLRRMKEDRTYRNRCVEGLAIEETKVLNAGLKALAGLQVE
jgi:hypothetical protein